MKRIHFHHALAAAALAATLLLPAASCKGPSLAAADAQMERGEYFEASKTYRKLYNKLKKPSQRSLRSEVAFKLGNAHSKLNQSARAAGAYRNALRYGYPDSTLYFRIASALHADGKYAEAIEAYRQHLMTAPGDEAARAAMRGAAAAAEMKAHPTRYKVAPAKLFNTRRADFAPAIQGDRLYFTSTSEKVTGSSISEVTGMKRGDIWVAEKDEQGRWKRPEPLGGDVNTEADEGTVAFSPDGRTMYFARAARRADADTKVELMTSSRSDASWSEPRRLELIADTAFNYGQPSVDPAGRYLYFASDRAGSFGATDIWRIALDAKGEAVPENLGPQINTRGTEMFPTAAGDSLLFFSSDSHAGMGGLDIYRAELQPTGSWKVTNMGVPLNSAADDFGMTFADASLRSGFFSTGRNDARGYDHVYSFNLPELNILIAGYVTDLEEEPIAGARIVIIGNDGSNRRAVARDDGSFDFTLDRGVSYAMQASAPGYINARQEFTSDTAEADAEYAVDFMLASLTRPNVVENIFYDYNKATLRPESTAALDSLATLLADNPQITVELGSHTDRVGSDAFNIELSERRAKSVVDYLVGAGIEPTRLTSKGYGKSQPKVVTRRINRMYPQFAEGQLLDAEFVETLEPADRDAADQINRRTEFRVISLP